MLTVADSALGEIVVDDEGFTLYVFIPDDGGDSTCYDECATAWPPLEGDPVATGSVDAALFGTSLRTDGAQQVTSGVVEIPEGSTERPDRQGPIPDEAVPVHTPTHGCICAPSVANIQGDMDGQAG